VPRPCPRLPTNSEYDVVNLGDLWRLELTRPLSLTSSFSNKNKANVEKAANDLEVSFQRETSLLLLDFGYFLPTFLSLHSRFLPSIITQIKQKHTATLTSGLEQSKQGVEQAQAKKAAGAQERAQRQASVNSTSAAQ